MDTRRTKRLALTSLAAGLLVGSLAGPAEAVTGNFMALLDKQSNFGDSRRSIVFFDMDALAAGTRTEPIFAVFAGREPDQVGGTFAPNLESPAAITVDPATGDVYFTSRDRGAPSPTGSETVNTTLDTDNSLVRSDTTGDMDLFKIDFEYLYNDWVTNQGGSYVTYFSDQEYLDGSKVDFPLSSHATPVHIANPLEKIGEVARAVEEDFDHQLEFIDDSTLLMIDGRRGADDNNIVDDAAHDHEIRILSKVSDTPGGATATSNNNGTPAVTTDDYVNGGYNADTTQTWTSTVIGQVQMDGALSSDPERIAFYKDPVSGTMGFWIGENDGGSDVVNDNGTPGDPSDDFTQSDSIAFYEITNLTGLAGNGYKELQIGPGNPFPTDFELDDNPVLDPTTNDGAHDGIFVDADGNLVIIESGFFDQVQDEPSIITREILNYDDPDTDSSGADEIVVGAWGFQQLPTPAAIDDDDTAITDGRWTAYDANTNTMYFYDLDTGNFLHDFYAFDMDTGTLSLLTIDVDDSNGLFGTGDQLAFFSLSDTIPGDFDGDGDKDNVDIDMYIGLLGTTVPPTDAKFDLDADNDVDIDDYNLHATTLLEWANGGNGQSGMGTLLGDYNLDGVVSLLDLNTLGTGFGGAGGWADGDTNGDGQITLLDLNALGITFGQDVFVAPEASPAVPEPASLVLLGLGGMALLRRRH